MQSASIETNWSQFTVSIELISLVILDGSGRKVAVLQGPAEWDGETAISVIEKLIELVG